ncbi:fibrobacter succinogenes major paralogous domain-containing protein [Fibrobacter succinogenes]|uniref:fibrobacter succinogenes major paralogous domain-containing protein n=1 Tax=Fibrobacter succinogenes TaxID=833 RepID=UPI001565B7FE|nr:fibrobacter succinogenes major paralogous domain-containing protein [Fibrobacter succinogenes]
MEKFAETFAETGKWKDSTTKNAISEWAIEATANGGLDSIRKNVEAWDLGDTVPAFEKFIEAYADGDSIVLIVTPKSSSSETSVSSSSRDTTYNAEKNTLTDTRDGQVYRTVTIGDQVWMAENLNFETDSSYCYNDSAEYCAKYGRLYIWDAAMNACPEGWHLPDTTEWVTLITAVGGKLGAGEKLMSTSGWIGGKGEARNGTDEYGFAALPGGDRDEKGGLFSSEGGTANFWSSTENGSDMATGIVLLWYYNYDVFLVSGKHFAMSVRCLNDDTAIPPSSSSSKPVETSSSSGISSSSQFKRVLCNVDTDKNCFKDERDGQTYRMVKIGNQVWMAENMNYETAGSYCYNDYAENCKNYGRLYTWGAAMDSAGVWSTDGKGCGRHILDGDGFVCSATFPVRGVCPEGWHLPDTTEWYILFAAVGGQSSSGKALKSTSGWDKWDDNGNGEDTYGFSGLPAGASSYDMFQFALFWSSVEHYTGGYNIDAYGMSLYYKSAVASLYREPKSAQFSVRCLKNDDGTVPKSSSSSADEVNCSALLEEERKNGAWSWDVPKECRFNPDIDYGSMTDERDGKVYRTVKIGNQVWMAENLNYYDSTNLNIKETSWCYGKSDNKDSSTCDVTGRLYTWAAAITVCPSDWRLPSDADWDSLFSVVGGRSGGRNLKSLTGWYGDGGGTDSFGFSAIPGGHKSDGGAFFSVGIYAYFWSSTEREDGKVRGMSLYYSYDDMTPYIIDKYIAYSVRCVKG